MIASGFSWMTLVPSLSDKALLGLVGQTELVNMLDEPYLAANSGETFMIMHAWLSCLLIVAFAIMARAGIATARKKKGIETYFAQETLTFRTAAEVYVGGLLDTLNGLLDRRDSKMFASLIGSLFVYILVCNIQGIFPGFLPPTDNINTNVGMAIIIFCVFLWVGLVRDAKGFLAHMFGPMLLLGPFLFVIETVGLIIRPVSLSLRLTGNIFGDHTVFTVMSDLVPVIVPSIFLGLAIFVSLVQAYVFSLLSTIYISLSVPHHDAHD